MTHGGMPFDWDQPAPASSLPELVPDDAPYTGRVTFVLQTYQVRHDGSQILRAAGLDHGGRVGFELCLGPAWKAAPGLAGTILACELGSVIRLEQYRRGIVLPFGQRSRPDYTGPSIEWEVSS